MNDDFGRGDAADAGSIWLQQLLERSRSSGTADELSNEAVIVGAMAAALEQAPIADIGAHRTRRHRLAPSKLVVRSAIVVAGVLVGASTVAATGNLPANAQSAVARATSHLGFDIPDPHRHRDGNDRDTLPSSTAAPSAAPSTAATSTEPTASTVPATEPVAAQSTTSAAELSPPATTTAIPDPDGSAVVPAVVSPVPGGPDPNGPAKKGLCQAWSAHRDDDPADSHSVALQNLVAAAAAAGQTVEQFCAAIEPSPSSTPTTLPAAITTTVTTTAPDSKDKNKNKPHKEKPAKDKGDDKAQDEQGPEEGG
ncbi:MAG: hypothetical protein JWN99_833 [Ilumatobacteraceae bacterium]|nr:hypothetical protein [Ilumatobacteraceae bacterium]